MRSLPCLLSLGGAFLAAAIGWPVFASASLLDARRRSSEWPHRPSSLSYLSSGSEKPRLSPPLAVNDVARYGIHKTASLEIEQNDYVFGLPFFFTSIAVGTPPQPFCMLIDLGYGGMAVRAVGCQRCGRDIFSYNSSASSTSHDADCRVALPAAAHHARGSIFQDDIHLASVQLTNATFVSIDEFYGENWEYLILEDFCDGVIGLAPPNASSISYLAPRYGSEDPPPGPNFLHELTHGGALEREIVVLSLPKDASSKGHLMLGMEPSHVDYRMPFSRNNTWSALEYSWKVDLSILTFDSRCEEGNSLILDSKTVAAVTVDPGAALALPTKDVEQIWQHLGARADPVGNVAGGIIACEDLPLMPNMSLTLGGTQVELTWHSYTSKLWISPSDPVCMVDIQRAPWPAGIAIIGLRLFRGFGLVFDMEKEEFGLIQSATREL